MRTYTFISAEEANALDYSQVCEESVDKLRFSLDGTQTFVRYEDGQPSFLWGKTEYTDEEILEVLATDEWTSDEPI